MKLLLETTPSVMNWQDYEGRTPLHLAVEIGNNAVVSLLVSIVLTHMSTQLFELSKFEYNSEDYKP